MVLFCHDFLHIVVTVEIVLKAFHVNHVIDQICYKYIELNAKKAFPIFNLFTVGPKRLSISNQSET